MVKSSFSLKSVPYFYTRKSILGRPLQVLLKEQSWLLCYAHHLQHCRRISFSAVTMYCIMLYKKCSESASGILRSLISMNYQASCRPFFPVCLAESILNKHVTHFSVHRPSDHFLRINIKNYCQIKIPSFGWNVCDISNPYLILALIVEHLV